MTDMNRPNRYPSPLERKVTLLERRLEIAEQDLRSLTTRLIDLENADVARRNTEGQVPAKAVQHDAGSAKPTDVGPEVSVPVVRKAVPAANGQQG